MPTSGGTCHPHAHDEKHRDNVLDSLRLAIPNKSCGAITNCKIRETEPTKTENSIHGCDLITDNVINDKIGLMVADIIFVTAQTAVYGIKNISLFQCSQDQIDNLDITKKLQYLLHRTLNAEEMAKHELADQCMRQPGGNINPRIVRQFIDYMDAILKEDEKDTKT